MKQLIESKWEEILSLLETQYDISGIMINTWIRSLKIHEVKDNTVYFYVDEKLGENAVNFLYRKEFDIFLLSWGSPVSYELSFKNCFCGIP